MFSKFDVLPNKIPNEIYNDIFKLANNKCSICHIVCVIPYKKLSKFYYCSKACYLHF